MNDSVGRLTSDFEPNSLFQPTSPRPPRPARIGYARIAVERGIERLSSAGTLTYGITAPVEVGDRVIVPLGKQGKPTAGIVTAVGGPLLLDGLSPVKAKDVLEVTGIRLLPDLVQLAHWMAEYYVCPLGMVMASMLPAAVKRGTGLRTRTHLDRVLPPSSFDLSTLKPKIRAALDNLIAMDTSAFPIEPDILLDRLACGNRGPINRLITLGILKQVEVEVVSAASSDRTSRGYVTRDEHEITLNQEQTRAIQGIASTLGTFAPHLLHGVTGSGKTEIYLRVLKQVIARGQSAIVLVPEIALTPQTALRFQQRFERAGLGGVAVLHSGLSGSQRNSAWRRAASGDARVVIGARSAIFSPLTNLGLIVVDEEHDNGYKQDQLPRYHARDVAIKRGQIAACPVILGSATPSLESWSNAHPEGTRPARFTLWQLKERATGGVLPTVKVVDLAIERQARAQHDPTSRRQVHLIGPTLEAALDRTLRSGGQAILLLNRRGFANYIACPSSTCGWVLSCDQCDARLVLHKSLDTPRGGFVECHQCRGRNVLPLTCPSCGRPVITFGLGTQRVEDELERKFGPAFGIKSGTTLLRCDSDTLTSASDYDDALSRFGTGEVKILIGTQMIAKGLDYPNVRLVGVVMADTALSMPDFRASERTFQLISQVAGRAGRGDQSGLVIVQTLSPDSRAIQLAALHDYEGFARQELLERRRAQLPPARRMARIVCRDLDASQAKARASEVASVLRETAAALHLDVSIRGPMEASIARIASHYRQAVEVLAPDAQLLVRVLSAVRAAGVIKSDSQTAIDVDPIDLM
jgi:primosomal protein N' (replication factor Y)